MGDRLILTLGYGTVFISTALWVGHHFWFHDRRMARAAWGSGMLAVLLLAGGVVAYGFRVGYRPFHTAYELLNVGLLGLLSVSLAFLSPRRDGRLLTILSVVASLVAAYGLWASGPAVPAIFVYDSGWWAAYAILSSFGGGATVVTGAASVAACRRRGQDSRGEDIVAQRALAWGLLTLSAGLASGMWWFHRLSGRYWGDARWARVAIVGLLAAAAWHVRQEWLGRGWRSALVGAILGLSGGYVLLGLGCGG